MILTDENIHRLSVEVIARAVRDVMGKELPNTEHNYPDVVRGQARDWLTSQDCAMYCDIAGVSFDKLQAWIDRGCPDPEYREGKKHGGGRRKKDPKSAIDNQRYDSGAVLQLAGAAA